MRDRHGIHVVVLPTEALGEERLTALLRYRFAQYLALGFVDPALAFEQGMEHEPAAAVSPSDLHYIATAGDGEILSYATLRAVAADDGVTMRTRGRPQLPVERAFGEGVFDRLAVLPDLPVARVRELGRFVKNQRMAPLDERLTRAPVEVALAIGRTLLGALRTDVAALVGGLEEHVFKRVLDFVHFPTVVVHGAIPYVAESSYYHPLYVRRQSLPFAVLCHDIATHATERLAAIELALGESVAAVIGLRRGPGPPASSLEPPGGLPALTDAEVPYADISLPARRELIDAGARLRASDPFAGLSVAEATALRRLMERREYEPGATIVRQGEPGDALYVIEGGVAEVRVTDPGGRTRPVRSLGAGEHFGEIALLGSGRRTADVVAVSAVTVLELRSEAYERYLTGVEDVEEELGRAAASRLAADSRRERIEPLAGADPLWLDPEAMRRLGYRTVDMLVEHLADPARQPPLRVATPAEMQERLSGDVPAAGREFDAILAELQEHVLPFVAHWGHPGYFAFIPGSSTFPGALGDFIASALNIDAGSWTWGSGPSHIELMVLDWFKDWIGYPPEAAGVLLSGGSAANMTALACAREALAGAMSNDLVAYCSDQAHSSVARAARALGFRPEQLRVLPTDDHFRMRPDALAKTIEADVAAGRRPLFVAAAAGSTNTGAVDPFEELAAIAAEHGAWFHVDGAYGAFAVLTERGAGALSGLALADSVTLDPHKWLYQPFECGCLLVRDGHLLDEAFVITPDYLKDVEAHQEVNFSDRGFQLTRVSRALKLWVSLNYFGLDTFRAAIDRTLDLAQLAQRRVQESDELELLLPTSLGVTCFRRRFGGGRDEDELARLNAQLVSGLAATEMGLISSTRLRGRYALRLCVLNHTTAESDVEGVLSWLEQAEVEPADELEAVQTAVHDRHPDVASVRLERDRVEPEAAGRAAAVRVAERRPARAAWLAPPA